VQGVSPADKLALRRRPRSALKEGALHFWASWRAHWHEAVGLAVATLGAVSLVAVAGLTRGRLALAVAEKSFAWFGIGAPAVCLAALVGGLDLMAKPRSKRSLRPTRRSLGLALIWLGALLFAGAAGGAAFGGTLGWLVSGAIAGVAGPAASFACGALCVAAGVGVALRLSWSTLAVAATRALAYALQEAKRAWAMREQRRALLRQRVRAERVVAEPVVAGAGTPERAGPRSTPEQENGTLSAPAAAEPAEPGTAELPPLSLFDQPAGTGGAGGDEAVRAAIIEETLAGFGIPAKVVEIQRGPAVTQFGLQPGYIKRTERGKVVHRKVRVGQVKALADDLALALAAAPIRIEAPIPGRPLIGIEVPNAAVQWVCMREVLESPEYAQAKGELKLALGKDIAGMPVVVALESLPHLFIAGATGSGKSVCIGAIIASLLYSCTPQQVKLLLIDPKRVELTRYNGIPHLVGRVEVEVDGAVAALRWASKQMEERYRLFAEAGARDLVSYRARRPEATLPRLVIIIDELADLMLSAPDEVEQAICRLAQMARGAGIHLVVATQRPSVDVVTGLIKANFPARIAFAVSSQVDSRVILDTAGAEALIGHGDMLFMAPEASRLRRLQGTFVSDEETKRLVEFWRAQAKRWGPPAVCPWSALLEGEDSEDELFEEAVRVAREVSAVSASYLQRRLRIGYPRAARLLDLLTAAGIVGPGQEGSKVRPVLANVEADGPTADGSRGEEAPLEGENGGM